MFQLEVFISLFFLSPLVPYQVSGSTLLLTLSLTEITIKHKLAIIIFKQLEIWLD
jgi:hypothetical protein